MRERISDEAIQILILLGALLITVLVSCLRGSC